MKEQIIKIIESKAQGKYHLEIDESDLEIIANEILDLFSVSKQRELLECDCTQLPFRYNELGICKYCGKQKKEAL